MSCIYGTCSVIVVKCYVTYHEYNLHISTQGSQESEQPATFTGAAEQEGGGGFPPPPPPKLAVGSIPYSQKIWRELYLADWPPTECWRILIWWLANNAP